MTGIPAEEVRLRCPKCNRLRKGFSLESEPQFLVPERVGFKLKCQYCGNEFFANYDLVEVRNIGRLS